MGRPEERVVPAGRRRAVLAVRAAGSRLRPLASGRGLAEPERRRAFATASRPGPAVREEALVATFRHLFAMNGSALGDRAASYCVGSGDWPRLADPPPSLLRSLSGRGPTVRPASACRTGVDAVDPDRRPSLVFNAAPLGCDGGVCRFRAGYFEGDLGASQTVHRVRRVRGAWRVTWEGPDAAA